MATIKSISIQVQGLLAGEVAAMQTQFTNEGNPNLSCQFTGGSSGSFPNFSGSSQLWTVTVNEANANGVTGQSTQDLLAVGGVELPVPQ